MATLWLPDWPPETPSNYDDEFADASFDTGKWSEWDSGNVLTPSESDYGLSLLFADHTQGDLLAGIYQAVPADNWAAWAKVDLLGERTSAKQFKIGLLLGENLSGAPTTSDALIFVMSYYQTSDFAYAVDTYSNYNTWASTLGTVSDAYVPNGVYLRIRKASTTYSFDFSVNGIGWQRVYTTSSMPFTPAQIGLVCNSSSSDGEFRGACQFFRVAAATPTLTDVMYGRRVDPASPYASSSGLPFMLMQGQNFRFRRGASFGGMR